MEDSHIANVTDLGPGISFFGVFDGHGGKRKHIFLRTKHIFFVFLTVNRSRSCPLCQETLRQRVSEAAELQAKGL